MVQQGCVRALGIQTKAAIIAIACFYIISIPSSCILTFTGLFSSLQGTIKALWIGSYIGVFVQLVLLGYLTIRISWRQ